VSNEESSKTDPEAEIAIICEAVAKGRLRPHHARDFDE
jgi:hypothetical protein